MLRQFGLQRPVAPLRPMMGMSPADMPMVPFRPGVTPYDMRMMAMGDRPYYEMLPPAFNVMPFPSTSYGSARERREGGRRESEDMPQEDTAGRSHEHRRRLRARSAPQIHREHPSISSSSSEAHSQDEGASATRRRRGRSPHRHGSRQPAKTKGEETTTRKRRHDRERSPPPPSSRRHADRNRKHRRETFSKVSLQPPPVDQLQQNMQYLRLRDVPMNVPIHNTPYASQPFPCQRLAMAYTHPQGLIPGSAAATFVIQPGGQFPPQFCPYSAVPGSKTAADTQPLQTVPASSARREDGRDRPATSAAKLDSKDAQSDRSRGDGEAQTTAVVQASHTFVSAPAHRVGLSTKSLAGSQEEVVADRAGKEDDGDEEDTDEQRASMLAAEQAAKARSTRIVKLWLSKMGDIDPLPAIECDWSFTGSKWYTGCARIVTRKRSHTWTCSITYRSRSDGESQCVVADPTATAQKAYPDAIDDLRALKAFLDRMAGGREQSSYAAPSAVATDIGEPLVLFRLGRRPRESYQAPALTDFLVLGSIKRGKARIIVSVVRRQESARVSAASSETRNQVRWRWILEDGPPDFRRWSSASAEEAEENEDQSAPGRLDVAFRPSQPSSEIYPVREDGILANKT